MRKNGDTTVLEARKSGRKGRAGADAYEALKKKLITLELRPGEHLDEKRLMKELGVGRTPLRECILRLKTEGLVAGEHRRPAFVRDISLKDTKDILEALLVVEKSVVALAALRARDSDIANLREINDRMREVVHTGTVWDMAALNQEFHRAAAYACGNDLLYKAHQSVRNQAARLAYLSLQQTVGSNQSVGWNHEMVDQHDRIISCMVTRDPETAEQLAIAHIGLFRDRISRYLADCWSGFGLASTPIAIGDSA